MATYFPELSKSSGILRIKFNAWLRHSSSDELVLPDFRCFLFFGEDVGMGAAA
jgi:predicted KAP-like P-loop ATPase